MVSCALWSADKTWYNESMESKVLNFRVIVEPEKMGGKTVYNAYCPTLGIADYGNTIEEALKSMEKGIELALECKKEEKEAIVSDNIAEQIITSIQIPLKRLSIS